MYFYNRPLNDLSKNGTSNENLSANLFPFMYSRKNYVIVSTMY